MVTDYSKQIDLIKPHEFKKTIHVIGCGAIGSWVVFFLLKMGFDNIHVYDFDIVEEHNLPNQMFSEHHINMLKVDAMFDTYTKSFIETNNTTITSRLTIHNEKITARKAATLDGIIISCVDSMEARKEIYENALKFGSAELWIEGRIGIYGAYVYTVERGNMAAYTGYEKTLYADEDAEVSSCGVSQTALPAAVSCASQMIMTMIAWHNEWIYYNEVQFQIPQVLAMSTIWK